MVGMKRILLLLVVLLAGFAEGAVYVNRQLPSSASPESLVNVTISLDVNGSGIPAVGIRESVPNGWIVSNIPYGGMQVNDTGNVTPEGNETSCELIGNYPPCAVVTLDEVVDHIVLWSSASCQIEGPILAQCGLAEVIDLVNAWAERNSNGSTIEWLFWSLWYPVEDRTITYTVEIPENVEYGTYSFSGTIYNGAETLPLGGDSELVIAASCTLEGDYSPCDEVNLLEVIQHIILWSQGEASLGEVINLIIRWANPITTIISIDALADGSKQKNITFTSTGNQTDYLEIPKEVNVINATMQLTGYPYYTNISLGPITKTEGSPIGTNYTFPYSESGRLRVWTDVEWFYDGPLAINYLEEWTVDIYWDNGSLNLVQNDVVICLDNSLFEKCKNAPEDENITEYYVVHIDEPTNIVTTNNVENIIYTVTESPMYDPIVPHTNNLTITPTIEKILDPTNPTLDVGDNGDYEWSYSGEFNSTEAVPDFSSELNEYLSNCTPSYGNCTMPLVFSSDSAGIIRVSNISIEYSTTTTTTTSTTTTSLTTTTTT